MDTKQTGTYKGVSQRVRLQPAVPSDPSVPGTAPEEANPKIAPKATPKATPKGGKGK